MKIGIIGAGNIGGNLTRRLTALGHEVAVANSRGPQTLTALAEETGATPVTASEAAKGAQVVVVTVPLKAVPDLPAGFLDGAAEGAAVIDTGNYYPQQRDGRIAAIEEGLPESRWTEQRIGHPVIKAFNGTYAQDILDRGRPQGSKPAGAPGVGGRPDGQAGGARPHRRAGLRHGRQRWPGRFMAPAARHPGVRQPGRRRRHREGALGGLAGTHCGVARLTAGVTREGQPGEDSGRAGDGGARSAGSSAALRPLRSR